MKKLMMGAMMLMFSGGLMTGMTSCKNPEANARLMALSEIGMTAARAKGVIEPGDVVTIRQGLAVLTSEKDTETKLLELAELGLEAAVARGAVKEGDVLYIQDAVAVIKPPGVAPPDVANAVAVGSGS